MVIFKKKKWVMKKKSVKLEGSCFACTGHQQQVKVNKRTEGSYFACTGHQQQVKVSNRTDMSSTGGGNKTEQPVVQAYTVEETTKPSTTAVEVSPLTGNSKITR